METHDHLAVLYVELFIPHSGSLKAKRSVLKSVKDRIRNHFNVSVAEVGSQDKWQRAVLGFAALSEDKTYLDRQLQFILSFLNDIHDFEVIEHRIEFI